ncbi:MAG: hypothetical protein E6Y83_17295 [Clostridium butyricum]|nr:hypothetical protein [Clostridium butyricum]
MTREEFKTQSNELFFKIKESLSNEILKSTKPAFDKASQSTDPVKALSDLNMELTTITSTLSFEASCDYSEKLALLLFDQLSK